MGKSKAASAPVIVRIPPVTDVDANAFGWDLIEIEAQAIAQEHQARLVYGDERTARGRIDIGGEA